MLKGIYFLYKKIDRNNMDGIEQKITTQIRMFKTVGIDFKQILLNDNHKLISSINFIDKIYKNIWEYQKKYSEADYIYFRRGATINGKMYSMLKRIKRDNPQIKILMEIPTFPYDGEYIGKLARFKLVIDKIYRKRLKCCIDRLVIFGETNNTRIWGIETLNIINGIDVERIKPRLTLSNNGEVNLICVAKFSPWHGYERLLNGLSEYYKNGGKREIFVHMVGDGPERERYVEIVKSSNLEDNVFFHGMLTGDQLDSIYNICDIGVTSLGRYKNNLDIIGDLKSREYLAKGIPMITGCKIDAFKSKEIDYICEFPNNGTNISVNRIVEFHEKLYSKRSKEKVTSVIRKFAKETIDIGITFKPVLRYLEADIVRRLT